MTRQEQVEFLRKAWDKIEWNMPEQGCQIGFDAVIGRYEQPGRHYHGLRHLVECLEHPEIDKAHNPTSVRLALFFHDYFYDTRAKDNEKRSADVLSLYISSWLRRPGAAYDGCYMILATEKHAIDVIKHHDVADDAKLVLDCDLSILGRPMERYAQYESDIQLEYSQYPQEVFKAARRNIMLDFAKREPLYFTKSFQDRYETQAKKNIAVYWR